MDANKPISAAVFKWLEDVRDIVCRMARVPSKGVRLVSVEAERRRAQDSNQAPHNPEDEGDGS